MSVARRSPTETNPLPERILALLRESRWLVLIAAALYLLLILASFDKADPGWSHSVGAVQIKNSGGRAGAWISDLMLYLFGASAYLWVLFLFFCVLWSYRRLESPDWFDRRPFYVAVFGFLALLTASSAIETLRFHSSTMQLPLAPGGMLGSVAGGALMTAAGFNGGTLILMAVWAVGFSLFTGISWLTLIERIGAGIEWVVETAIAWWQRRQDRKLGRVATIARKEIVEVEKKRFEDHEPIRIEMPEVAVKKSERAEKERQKPLFGDLPDSPLPPLHLLDEPPHDVESIGAETLEYTSRLIEKKLSDFGVTVKVMAAYPGPVITRYEIEPAVGVKGAQIVNLIKDLARALSVVSIRVVETIPGKTSMGLELPNPKRQIVRLSEILSSEVYQNMHSPLTLALGKDIGGHPVVADLAKMPHLLVAGTTGSGKSVAINAMILSLVYKSEPRDVRLIMIDPKMLELSVYEGIPHLLAPVVTDMKQAAAALNWCISEMERRYKLMSWVGVRNLSGFNTKIAEAERKGNKLEDPLTLNTDNPTHLTRLPNIVVVIDELADLMMVVGKKVEELIARLAQKARASGIHLLLATQRPSVDVITGLIKANIPTRVAFQVSSKIDSRTILDQMGAESLLGQGDMLYLPPGTGYPQRVHGAFVDDHEVHKVVDYLKLTGEPNYIPAVLDGGGSEGDGEAAGGEIDGEADPLYDQAVEIVLKSRRASISLVQRHLRIGYNRAARLIEQMERSGLVSSMATNGNREVLAPAQPER
jgi:DNA segregation ATPase FtsK/SpoIIIE, S-DNA-T family